MKTFNYDLIEKPETSFYFTAKVLSELEVDGSKFPFLFINDFLNGCMNLHNYHKKIFCRRLANILSNNNNLRPDYQNLSNLIIYDFLQEKTK